MTVKETYSIAELAQEYGITPRAIRFYEDQGLIHPKRVGQQRIYNKADHARLAWILRGKAVGFSLNEIGELLDLYSREDGRETQRLVTLDRCRSRIDDLEKQKNDIGLMIKELEDFCTLIQSPVTDGKIKKASVTP